MGQIEVANNTDAINVSFTVFGNQDGNKVPVPGASGNLNASSAQPVAVSGYTDYIVDFGPVGFDGSNPAFAASPPIVAGSVVQLAIVPIDEIETFPEGITIGNGTNAPGVIYAVEGMGGGPVPGASGSLTAYPTSGWVFQQEVSGYAQYKVQFLGVGYNGANLGVANSAPISGENTAVQLAIEVRGQDMP